VTEPAAKAAPGGPPASGPPVSWTLAFLAHREGDDVAIAVRDTDPGTATCAYLESGARFEVGVRAPIPLGHKVALRDLTEGADVIEYGERIGLTRCAIAAGEHVHTHNLRSARWQRST
jgi:(2R)-sulfolactate sulfo-lyase subunit alpha